MDEHRPQHIPLFTRTTRPPSVKGKAASVRLRHGVYAPSDAVPQTEWEAMHFVRMQAAAARMAHQPVFSHWSAAVVLGIPVVGRMPRGVHMIAAGRVGRRSQRGIVWHNDRVTDEEIIEVGGILVTDPRRTLIDLGRVMQFPAAVAAFDAGVRPWLETPWGFAIPGAEVDDVAEGIARLSGRRGIRAARAAVEFADPRSGSAGESVSRAHMHLLRIPAPDLQVAFPRAGGGHDIVDFDWPGRGRFGEFDGRGKYRRQEFTQGRSAEEIVWQEKLREDRIRRHRPIAVRWDWDIAIRPAALAARLAEFGIHPGSGRLPASAQR